LEATRATVLKVFKAESVDFLLMDKELVSHFVKDQGKTKKLDHAHFGFEVAIP
jgi:hypothetical protein